MRNIALRNIVLRNTVLRNTVLRNILTFLVLALAPGLALASASSHYNLGLTTDPLAVFAVVVFVVGYMVVMAEEFIHLRKSKPVILSAGVIWATVAYLVQRDGHESELLKASLNHNLIEYAALFLFLLVAMTYINAMTERNVFEALRSWLVRRQFGYRKLFWITGGIAFFLSPIADNLTTALLMGAVVLSVGGGNKRFVGIGCINIVVAANAGGAFSPFGDITTLMVWQMGHATFFDFFDIFLPSVATYVVPAAIMSFAVPDEQPRSVIDQKVELKRGAFVICGLFLCTIATAVSFKQFFHLPPYFGMMTGLSYLFFYGYYLKITAPEEHPDFGQFNIFNKVAQAEWDTLFFFFGVIFCVGGLGFIGYLEIVSVSVYGTWGPTIANIAMGVLSAIVDNIPVMFAVLVMEPDMDLYQWLLITLTTGVGGSLLSIGSAAGVALMGQARGFYTFFGHLKWSWAIGLGYAAGIYVHYLVNA